jgi:hypothetical protein
VLVVLGVLAGGGLLVILILAALLLPAIGQARQAARRAQSTGHLKQIALGLHNYADSFGMLPYAGAEDREYGLGLSGRVRLLPFLEEGNLHGRVNYDEPWDSPANQFLSSSMPRVYHSPMQPDSRSHSTYLANCRLRKGQAGRRQLGPEASPAGFQPRHAVDQFFGHRGWHVEHADVPGDRRVGKRGVGKSAELGF